jgi:hypothetical protein
MEVNSFPYIRIFHFIAKSSHNKQAENLSVNCIGAIYSKRNRRREFVGTGILISSDLVLTVAHNIYTHESKERWELEYRPD